MTRTITGPLNKPSGTPWASAAIAFRLVRPFVTSAATIGVFEVAVTTDANGQFSVTLETPDDGAAPYTITLPNGNSYTINIAAGAATTLHALLLDTMTQPSLSALAAHAATIASALALGHIRPDGTTITVDPVTGIASAAGGGGAPSGPAGGVLSGTYPDPGFAVDMATQAELNAHEADTTNVHGIANTALLLAAGDVPRVIPLYISPNGFQSAWTVPVAANVFGPAQVIIADLTGCTEARIWNLSEFRNVPGLDLSVTYRAAGTADPLTYLDGATGPSVPMANGSSGIKISAWTTIIAAARHDPQLHQRARGGDGATSYSWGPSGLMVR